MLMIFSTFSRFFVQNFFLKLYTDFSTTRWFDTNFWPLEKRNSGRLTSKELLASIKRLSPPPYFSNGPFKIDPLSVSKQKLCQNSSIFEGFTEIIINFRNGEWRLHSRAILGDAFWHCWQGILESTIFRLIQSTNYLLLRVDKIKTVASNLKFYKE